jgi:plasmid maintenance system antidote protein VapI
MRTTEQPEPTAADIRALIARKQTPIYQLAARVRMHPARLSLVLNGKTPLTPALAARIAEALQEL